MRPFVFALAVIAAALAPSALLAQNKVRTETIRPPAAPAAPNPAVKPQAHAPAPGSLPATDILTDLSQLPEPVARMRARILAAARSGEIAQVVALMQAQPNLPVFSFAEDKDPAAFWAATYPDSQGIEALSILVSLLETGFVRADPGTPQEIYVWPYFARLPMKTLTPAQKVELFRIITGYDYKEMAEFGAYIFYRVGITPDGTWQFFVSGD